jgi:hypothetical protein
MDCKGEPVVATGELGPNGADALSARRAQRVALRPDGYSESAVHWAVSFALNNCGPGCVAA